MSQAKEPCHRLPVGGGEAKYHVSPYFASTFVAITRAYIQGRGHATSIDIEILECYYF
jgi:hypothetical protein